jgi:hypothetical protein
VKYIRDITGRLSQRPHFEPIELDRECERIVFEFLKQKFGELRFPIPTDALEVLLEKDAQDLDMYADLSDRGPDVEGVTEFIPGQKPRVKISKRLSEDPRLENRLRTTLTHEFGHVKFHAPLWQADIATADMFGKRPERMSISCKRENIVGASEYDWMEWQAGYVCGAVLMPHTRVKTLAKEVAGRAGQQTPLGTASTAAQELIAQVMEAFKVSSDAARVRLIKLKVIAERGAGVGLFAAER